MFEDKTYENLLQSVLNNAPDDIDTRPGSIFYDAVSGIIIKVAEFYKDLELIFKLSRLDTAEDEYLDAIALQFGIKRQSATKARYFAEITGETPDDGERFFYNGMYFVFRISAGGTPYFEAEEPGTEYNKIFIDTSITPVDTIPGLEASSFGSIMSYAIAEESNENLRMRLYDKISGAGENGNKQHYRLWCESVDGVAKAKIFPLWMGGNTVKAVLIDADGLPCQPVTVDSVQKYIDPNDRGKTIEKDGYTYNFGDGLGEGAANIGAHFTAVGAFEHLIDIAADVKLAAGITLSDAQNSIAKVLAVYFKDIVLASEDEENMTVYYNRILSLITTSVPEIIDFKNLTVNSKAENITISPEYVPKMGVVTLNAII